MVSSGPRVRDALTSIPEINETVTFNRGEFRKNVTFVLADDNFALERMETYSVALSILIGADISRTTSPDTAVINARDDDGKLINSVRNINLDLFFNLLLELVIGFGRPNVTVQEDMRTFMMCVIQRGLAAIDYNVNIASEDGSAIAGSGRKWGKRERERG